MKQLDIFQKSPEPDYEKLKGICQTTGTAFQKLIRDVKSTADLSPRKVEIKSATVAEVTYQQAKKIILDYEWLGTMPSQVCAAFGIFFGNDLGGVVCFSDVRQQTKMSFLNHPAVILARGACVHWAHPHSASFLISRACKMLDDKYDFVIAYSDPEAGEIGTVYQACNWFCVGTSQKMRWTAPDGSMRSAYHHRNLACSKSPKRNGKRTTDKTLAEEIKNKLLSEGWKWELGPKRYRYAFPLGAGSKLRKLKKMLKEISIPYPKRNKKLSVKKQLVIRSKRFS